MREAREEMISGGKAGQCTLYRRRRKKETLHCDVSEKYAEAHLVFSHAAVCAPNTARLL